MWKPPHVSLTKAPGTSWKDLGAFVEKTQQAQDWRPDGQIERSKTKGLTRSTASWSVLTVPEVHLQKSQWETCSYPLTEEEEECLKDLTSHMWSTVPADVGLLRSAQPVIIRSVSPQARGQRRKTRFYLGKLIGRLSLKMFGKVRRNQP